MHNDWRRHYIKLTEFLGRALGPDYELVLHDLSNGGHQTLAISNPHVSGRGKDAHLSDLALEFLRSRRYERENYVLSYEGISASGEKLSSSTMFIKGGNGELLGMLCVNFRAGKYSRFAEEVIDFLSENLLSDADQTGTGRMTLDLVENFSESVAQRFRSIAFSMFGSGASPERLTQKQKLEILSRLDESGVFLVKGAIPEVAELLGSSISSVYRYLAAIHKDSK